MEKKIGYYSFLASIASSIVIVLLFYILGLGTMKTSPEMYKPVDVYAGMVYVFVLSMIVSASIWPGIIEKKFNKN